MNACDVLELDITSDPTELPGVRQAFRAWTRSHGWADDEIADVILAVDEALSNVIRHGYDNQPGQKIEVRARTLLDPTDGEGVEIRIRDYGKQVPIEQICGRDLNDVRPGGLGVHIIRSLMSSAQYSHAAGGGMQLVMRKYRRGTGGTPPGQAERP